MDIGNHQHDFSFQKHLSFKADEWKVFKGPILPIDISEINIKLIRNQSMEDEDFSDVIFFLFGVCTLDFDQSVLAWDKRVWSFGSGIESYVYQDEDSIQKGKVININDKLTLKIDLINHEMSLKVNTEDFGVICTNLSSNVCCAISTRADLEVELEFLKNNNYFYEYFIKKKLIDINIQFQ